MLLLSSPVPVAMAMRRFFYPEGTPPPIGTACCEAGVSQWRESGSEWVNVCFSGDLNDLSAGFKMQVPAGFSQVPLSVTNIAFTVTQCWHAPIKQEHTKVQFNLIIHCREHGLLLTNGSKITKLFKEKWWSEFVLDLHKTTTHLLNF